MPIGIGWCGVPGDGEEVDKAPVVWTEPGGCSSCKHCGIDMDMDPFCAHPEVVKTFPRGLNINTALVKFCRTGDVLTLRVPREATNAEA